MTESRSVRIAVEGCGHGTLHAIYASVEQTCKIKGWPGVDLVIICGDFQSVRNAYDLNCVAMPAKYREMCDFHEYYSGSRRAPYLTIFVGGNHEASNYLFELYYGGWVAENIYFMGAANVLRLGPLRIAGMSGIWKGYDYKKLHHERLPYNESDIKTIFHVREIDARKLLQVTGDVDIGISHDWPRGIEWLGDWRSLFRRKAHLEEDARNNQLGNVAAKQVLHKLKPRWWFSGHLHCKYAAIVDHGRTQSGVHSHTIGNGNHLSAQQSTNGTYIVQPAPNDDEIGLDLESDTTQPIVQPEQKVVNEDEIELNLDDDMPAITPVIAHTGHQKSISINDQDRRKASNTDSGPSSDKAANQADENLRTETAAITSQSVVPPGSKTHFLALDKCMPGREFLQLMEIPVDADIDMKLPLGLSYDKEWLAITRVFALHEPLLLGEPKFNAPKADTMEEYSSLIAAQQTFINKLSPEQLLVPADFTITAPVYDGGKVHDPEYTQVAGGLREYTNPQTARFCKMLEIPNPFDVSEHERSRRMQDGPAPEEYRASRAGGRDGYIRGGRGPRGRGRGRGRGHV